MYLAYPVATVRGSWKVALEDHRVKFLRVGLPAKSYGVSIGTADSRKRHLGGGLGAYI